MLTRHWKTIVVTAIIVGWLLGHTWKGLFVYFQDDDMMNLYQAWILPWWKLALANVTPFTTVYRPFGALVYRVLYDVAGLNPLPFRIVAYLLLLVNTWLLFRIAKLLTGSTEIAVLAALIGSYHKRLMDVYLNNGTIYDLLCFAFFYLAVGLYIETRQKQSNLSGVRLVGYFVLLILALNSKEMAVTLPLVLVFYELIFHGPKSLLSRKYALWASFAIVAIAVWIKTGQGSLFANVPDYVVDLSARQLFKTSRPLLAQLFFLPESAMNTTKVVLLLALVWVVAFLTRQKALGVCAAIITFTPLPVNFIPYRGFFVMYVPLAGWAVYLATVLVQGREWLWRNIWKRPPLPAGNWEPERVFLFLFTACILLNVQTHDTFRSFNLIAESQGRIRTLKEDLLRMHPILPKHSRVLFLSDGFTTEDWIPVFIVRLTYHDQGIGVDRTKMMDKNPNPADYNHILEYRDGHYLEVPVPVPKALLHNGSMKTPA